MAGPLKVVHLASGDAWGGAERVLVLLVGGLVAQRDFQVEALLFNEGRLAEALRALGIRVHLIAETENSLPRLALATRRWLRAAHADVVHAHRYKEMLLAAFALPPKRRGLVVTVHGLEPGFRLTRRQLIRVWGSLFGARLAGAQFVAVSKELAERLGRRLGRRSVVNIPNPMRTVPAGKSVPDLRGVLGWSPSRTVIGFVGRLESVKGPDRFVDLAARHRGDAGFVFIGTGSFERELRGLVAAKGLADRVGFIGEVDDAMGYIRQLDLLALPSRHEGFPMVLLEAAACEIPAIAFDVGGVREVLADAPPTWLTEAGRMDKFRDKMEEVLEKREQTRIATVHWASSVRARFGLARVVTAYEAVYRAARGGN